MIPWIIALIPYYFIGVIPAGLIIARLCGVDITSTGSGNVGATNVARVVGKRAGLATLIIDVTKGLLAVYIAHYITDNYTFSAWAGLIATCGHCFSIPGKLKGGKGVATALGVIVALSPTLAGAALGIFLVVVGITRIVSLASISATLATPIFGIFGLVPQSILAPVSLIAILVVYRHRENIQRLIEGNEKRFLIS